MGMQFITAKFTFWSLDLNPQPWHLLVVSHPFFLAAEGPVVYFHTKAPRKPDSLPSPFLGCFVPGFTGSQQVKKKIWVDWALGIL